jgi:hypothetical protein
VEQHLLERVTHGQEDSWWFGVFVGVLHGLLFLLVRALALLPYAHPRMASEYEGLTALRQLEPPGCMGLNDGLSGTSHYSARAGRRALTVVCAAWRRARSMSLGR